MRRETSVNKVQFIDIGHLKPIRAALQNIQG